MAGHWVTIDERHVFIGGPGAGVGGVMSGAGSSLFGAGIEPIGTDRNKFVTKYFLNAGIPGGATTSAEIMQARHEVVSDISELSGESYDDVNDVVAQWSESSNNGDMRSLALQRDASLEFGVPLSDFTQGKIDDVNMRREAAAVFHPCYAPLLPSNQQRRIIRAMYDNTQTKLAEVGFKPGDKIRLYRGVMHSGEHNIGDVVDIQSNALSSWSSLKSIAMLFGEMEGVTFAMDVPIEMIVGSGRSGFGCLGESEFVLLGVPSVAEVVAIGE